MVDDRHVPIAALAHAQQCLATLVAVVDRVDGHGHRLADGHRRGTPVCVQAQHVALGDDAHCVLIGVDHDHRSDTQPMHSVDQVDE